MRCGAPIPGGRGCLGPVRICPGFGAGGPGREGIGMPRGAGLASGGAIGCPPPVASGGRTGAITGLATTGVSTISLGASTGASAMITGGGCAGSGSRATTCSSAVSSECSGCSEYSDSEGPRRAASSTAASPPRRRRTSKAWSSSSELECVFFSEMPSSGSTSMIAWGLTSSSRASSLIRILLILCGSGGISFDARSLGYFDPLLIL